MAKDDSSKKEKERKHKSKEKKLSPDADGISKKSSKKEKKDKKDKKLALRAKNAEAILIQEAEEKKKLALRAKNAENDNVTTVVPQTEGTAEQNGGDADVEMGGAEESMKKETDVEMQDGEEKKELLLRIKPVGALVPFANPLADEKAARKVFKIVKKGMLDSFLSLTHFPFHYLLNLLFL